MPPGHYRFRVLACNNDGVWNDTGAAQAITVAPFWWATTTFRLALVGVGAGLVGGFYQLGRARRRDLERLRLRIAGDLHDDVGSSLWSITLLSQMLQRHSALQPAERQDLSEIHRIALQTSAAIRDIVWLINPAFDTVQDLALRINDFAGTILRGVEYRWRCEPALLPRKLPLGFRQNLFLVCKEALTNVAKHAHATEVALHFEAQARSWKITIRDNGIGFHPAAATQGNGLKNLHTRARKMGAVLEVQSRPGNGSIIMFTLPRHSPRWLRLAWLRGVKPAPALRVQAQGGAEQRQSALPESGPKKPRPGPVENLSDQ